MEKLYVKPQIKWTKEIIKLLKDEYPDGDKKELAKKIGIKYSTLKDAARRFKIKSNTSSKKNKLLKLLYETNYNYYWYGFIMADGNIGEFGNIRFNQSIKDYEHLKKLGYYLNVEIKKSKKISYGKLREYCSFVCGDIENGLLLKNKLNIKGNKTYEPPDLSFLNTKDKFLSFFAGFIDGDGTIEKRKNKFSSLKINCHYNWMNNFLFFKEKLNEYFNFNINVKITKRGNSLFQFCGHENILILKKEFINMNLPVMERKWEINVF